MSATQGVTCHLVPEFWFAVAKVMFYADTTSVTNRVHAFDSTIRGSTTPFHLRPASRVAAEDLMSYPRRLFYGWWVVATAALGLFFGSFPIVVISFAVFFKPLSQEFHSGRAGISLAFTLHNLVAAVRVPLLAGRLVDRYGARKVILPYTVMLALM